MTIHLPENLERSILAEVENGHFVSVDDAMAEAVRLLLQQRAQNGAEPKSPALSAHEASYKPIWEVFDEIANSIPDEEWAKLPSDEAEQHDHDIYGTPKRPAS